MSKPQINYYSIKKTNNANESFAPDRIASACTKSVSMWQAGVERPTI